MLELESLAYLKGVLDGDGCIDNSLTNPRIVLDTTSKQNADKFSHCLRAMNLSPYMRELDREYCHLRYKDKTYRFTSHKFIVRATISPSLLTDISSIDLKEEQEKKSYIQGIYDSEGYIRTYCFRGKNGSPTKMIGICNKDRTLLSFVEKLLESLGFHPRGPYLKKTDSEIVLYRQNEIRQFIQIWGEKHARVRKAEP